MSEQPSKPKIGGSGIAIGLAIGLVIGFTIGAGMGNLGIGLGMGAGIGMSLGVAFEFQSKEVPPEGEEKKRKAVWIAIGIAMLGVMALVLLAKKFGA